MDWILKLSEWLEDNIARLRRLSQRYPTSFRIGVVSFAFGALAFGIYRGFSFYTFHQPTVVIAEYLTAINEGRWSDVHVLLASDLARGWPEAEMQKSYDGFVSHQSIRTELSSNNHDAVGAWVFGALYSDVTSHYRIQLRHEDLYEPRRYTDTLWAQIINRDKFDRLRSSPDSDPMRFTIVEVGRWRLQRNGLRWRIASWERVSATESNTDGPN
jgi:hypothetical protein